MGKHTATPACCSAKADMTAHEAGRLIASIMSEFRKDRPDRADEITELAIETALGTGMAPPCLDEGEEEDYATPHDDWAVLGLEVLGMLSPTFADHLKDMLDVAFKMP